MKKDNSTFFSYVAINAEGKKVKGVMEAEYSEKVKQKLRNQGLLVASIKKQSVLTKNLSLEIGGYPKARDLSVMCRQFVSMVESGVGITTTLSMLEEQTQNKRLKKALNAVRIEIEKGSSIAGAMEKHPKIFPSLMVSMMAAGEVSGNMDVAMERVAKQLDRTNRTQGLIKKAMIYPTIVLGVGVVITIAMLMFVIPAFEGMFESLGTDLPRLTIIYVNLSKFFRKNWFLVFPAMIAFLAVMVSFARTNAGRHIWGKLALVVPIVKNLTIKSSCSQFARTMSTLMGSGMRLVDALGLSAETVNNIWFQEAILSAQKQVVLGVPLSHPLEESGLFPPMVYHMLKIGEESGTSEKMLEQLADYYDEEVELAVQSMIAAMEPLIIIILAIIVGSLIIACLTPMISLYEVLDTI